jgi:hypothetical protein
MVSRPCCGDELAVRSAMVGIALFKPFADEQLDAVAHLAGTEKG